MSVTFDPYYKWLGILPKDQPPHHYRLLGLELFEDDQQVIEAAADRQLGFLRKFQSGEHAAACQKLLNEVSRARLCLLKDTTKTAYDATLRQQLNARPVFPGIELEKESPSPTSSPQKGFDKKRLVIPAAVGGVLLLLVIVSVTLFRGGGANPDAPVTPVGIGNPATAQATPQPEGSTTKPNTPPPVPAGAEIPRAPRPINILPLLTRENIVAGNWKIESDRLESIGYTRNGQIALPVEPPAEYTVHVRGTRLNTPNARSSTVGLLLVCGGHRTLFGMDALIVQGISGLHLLDSREWNNNETTLPGFQTQIGRPFNLDAIVRKNGIEVRVDDRTVVDWKGDFSRLAQGEGWGAAPPGKIVLASESHYIFTEVTLGPPLPPRSLPGANLKPKEFVDLLPLIDLKQDVWEGSVVRDGNSVKTDAETRCTRFSVPFVVPEEYTVLAVVESEAANREFYLGFPMQQGLAGMTFGNWDGKRNYLIVDQQPTPATNHADRFVEGQILQPGQNIVSAVVTKNHLIVQVGTRKIFDWRGDSRRLIAWNDWSTPGHQITVGTNKIAYKINQLKLMQLPPTPPLPPPDIPKNGDLLGIVDPVRDTLSGFWTKDNGTLIGHPGGLNAIRFPAKLPKNYEFRLDLIRQSGDDIFEISAPVNGYSVMIAIDGEKGSSGGVEFLESLRFNANSFAIRYPHPKLVIGTPAVVIGRIEGRHLQVEINGEPYLDLQIPEKMIDPAWDMRPGWLTPDERLQLAVTSHSSISIRSATFRAWDKSLPRLSPTALPAPAVAATEKAATALTPEASPAMKPAVAARKPELLPIPDLAARTVATEKIRELYSDDFSKAKKDPDKLALAATIEVLADDATNDAATRYAAVEQARQLATDAGDLTKALALVERLAEDFQIDSIGVKVTTLKSISPKLKSALLIKDWNEKSLTIVEQLSDAERYTEAADLALLVSQMAVKLKDKAVQTVAMDARKDALAQAEDFGAAEQALATLKTTPEDPAAKLIWGKWLCLNKSNWPEGLEILQSCSDDALKDLAKRDLANPTETTLQLQLGREWLEYAKSRKDHSLAEFAHRALFWLEQANVDAKGLAKVSGDALIAEAIATRDRNLPKLGLLDSVVRKVGQKKYVRSTETRHDSGNEFEDIPLQGGILVGFNCTVSKYAQYTVVKGLQPVYQTKQGIKMGVWRGLREGTYFELRAKPGYAVNGISSRVGAAYDDLQVSFARVTKTGLDPLRTYPSPVAGAARGPDAVPTVITSGDQPIVGIFGHADDFLHGMGLIIAK